MSQGLTDEKTFLVHYFLFEYVRLLKKIKSKMIVFPIFLTLVI